MSYDSLIPTSDLSATEVAIIKEIFKSPVIAKYLRLMALNDTKELLGLSGIGRSQEELAAAHRVTEGKLATLSTLLSLTEVQTKE